MELNDILQKEIKGSIDFFLDFTNLDKTSLGYGLTADSTQKPDLVSIAAVGSTLTAWVIAVEHGYLTHEKALEITRGTLHTLLENAPHHRGFFAHFIDMHTAQRSKKCEYSTTIADSLPILLICTQPSGPRNVSIRPTIQPCA